MGLLEWAWNDSFVVWPALNDSGSFDFDGWGLQNAGVREGIAAGGEDGCGISGESLKKVVEICSNKGKITSEKSKTFSKIF